MPRTLFDDKGNPVEVPTDDELRSLQEAQTQLSDARSKLADMEKTLGSSDPSIRGMRQRIKDLERLTKSAPESDPAADPTQPPQQVQPPVTAEEIARIADRQYVNRYRDRVLAKFGDKAETVRKFFDKFATGEELNEDMVDGYIEAAARAAGVVNIPNPDHMATSFRGHGAPQFPDPSAKQDFAETDQGKAMASAMGLNITPSKA